MKRLLIATAFFYVWFRADWLPADPQPASGAPSVKNASGANQPAASPAKSAPSSASRKRKPVTSKDAIENMQKLLQSVGAATPGSPGMALADKLDQLSKEKVGKVQSIGTRVIQTPRGPQTVPRHKIKEVPRLQFGELPVEVHAEYDPATRILVLNNQTTSIMGANVSSRGEAAFQKLANQLGVAATIYHECVHMTQGTDPGSKANESSAYRETWDTVKAWRDAARRNYEKSKTRENIRMLHALNLAWREYWYSTIVEGNLRKGKLDPSRFPEGVIQGEQVTNTPALQAEIESINKDCRRLLSEHQAMEILEGTSSGLGLPPKGATLDELLKNVRVQDPSELEKKLAPLAEAAILRGGGRVVGNPAFLSPDQLKKRVQTLLKGALPVIKAAWDRKASKVADAITDMSTERMMLEATPEKVMIDPETGTAIVKVVVLNEADFSAAVKKLATALADLTGNPPDLTVAEQWSVPGLKIAPNMWKSGSRTFKIKQPNGYRINLVRTIWTRVNLTKPRVPEKIVIGSFMPAEVTVLAPEIKKLVPIGAKGRCQGSYHGRFAPHKNMLKKDLSRKGHLDIRISGTRVTGFHTGENGKSRLSGSYNPKTKQLTATATTTLVGTETYRIAGAYSKATQSFSGTYTAVYTPHAGKHRFTESGTWTAKGKLTEIFPKKDNQ